MAFCSSFLIRFNISLLCSCRNGPFSFNIPPGKLSLTFLHAGHWIDWTFFSFILLAYKSSSIDHLFFLKDSPTFITNSHAVHTFVKKVWVSWWINSFYYVCHLAFPYFHINLLRFEMWDECLYGEMQNKTAGKKQTIQLYLYKIPSMQYYDSYCPIS